MFNLLALDTSPKWLLVLYICSGNPENIKNPAQDINCDKIEHPTYSLLHCQNEQTLAATRLPSKYFVSKSKCVEIIKKDNPNLG